MKSLNFVLSENGNISTTKKDVSFEGESYAIITTVTYPSAYASAAKTCEFIMPDGTTNFVQIVNNTFDMTNAITKEGTVKMQFKAVVGNVQWKSKVYEYYIKQSLNVSESTATEYPDVIAELLETMEEHKTAIELAHPDNSVTDAKIGNRIINTISKSLTGWLQYLIDSIGTLSNLTTIAKDSLVTAINELVTGKLDEDATAVNSAKLGGELPSYYKDIKDIEFSDEVLDSLFEEGIYKATKPQGDEISYVIVTLGSDDHPTNPKPMYYQFLFASAGTALNYSGRRYYLGDWSEWDSISKQLSQYVKKTTTINGHSLLTNIVLTALDVGALGAEETSVDSNRLGGNLPSYYEGSITAGTTAQYYRGDKTWQDLASDVRSAMLTGISTATNAVISATDSVLNAFGKLQAQISGILNSKGANSGIATLGADGLLTAGQRFGGNVGAVNIGADASNIQVSLDFTKYKKYTIVFDLLVVSESIGNLRVFFSNTATNANYDWYSEAANTVYAGGNNIQTIAVASRLYSLIFDIALDARGRPYAYIRQTRSVYDAVTPDNEVLNLRVTNDFIKCKVIGTPTYINLTLPSNSLKAGSTAVVYAM